MIRDTIDGVLIDSDEDGFHLILSGENAEYNFRIHDVAVELLRAVDREIRPWHAEGEAVYREMTAGVRFECDPDESAGLEDARIVAVREDGSYRYERDDDEGWRDAADLQRKREKGE